MGHHHKQNGEEVREVPCPADEGILGGLFGNNSELLLLVLAFLFLFFFCRGEESDPKPGTAGVSAANLIEQLSKLKKPT